ncbi:hypothetical protein G6F62_001607 [Rhizopus arrhizus]|nr:hypothetical protein G6F23_001257 [Rhizopus arrhizus]KAG1296769.1 hypothetical protein G6F66_003187 [Rhizopus arrhizus]KAG1357439.1 hypothetical protein G6F62_001607 [Rhizopus arrhizus]
MINVVQPKTSSSTPSSFFKSKSSTLKRYNKNKLSLQENGKQRKRSASSLSTAHETSLNTACKADIPEPSSNKSLVTSLSLRAYKKQHSNQNIKVNVDTVLLNTDTTKYITDSKLSKEEKKEKDEVQPPVPTIKIQIVQNRKENDTPKKAEFYNISNNTSSGSLISSETGNSSRSHSTEIGCNTSNVVSDTFINSLSTTTEDLCSVSFAKEERNIEDDVKSSRSSMSLEEHQYKTGIRLAKELSNDSQHATLPYEPSQNSSSNSLQEPLINIHPTASISSQIISSSKLLLKKSMNNKFSKEQDKTKKRSVSLLRRAKSQRWSGHETDLKVSAPYKIDPTVFLAAEPSVDDNCHYRNDTFALMNRLLKSMTSGGYVTNYLHVPMSLWYQPSVRLPYVEAKIAASELLIAVLEKISTRNSIDHNLNAVLNELQGLRQTLNQINDTLMRKLGCPIPVTPIDDQVKRNSHRQSTNRTSQTIGIWSSKLTKSVEKMRFDSTRSSEP